MKALTVAPDWGMLIFQGEKKIEFRTWETDYRGDIVFCTSSRKIRGCISGHAIMVAELVNIEPFNESHLDGAAMDNMPTSKGYAWIFDNFRMIKPIPVKGKLHLFDIDINPEYVPEHFTDEEADDYIDKFIRPIIFLPVER